MVKEATDQNKVILVVDDEAQLRKLTSLLLGREGYRVLLASSGDDALNVSRGYAGRIHLLLTDVEMPGMSGEELASQLLIERPGMPVLLNSANLSYSQQTNFPFLAKPFTPAQLRTAVANALESSGRQSGGSGDHIDEDHLERYARNMLSEEECRICEEHLLICEACRNALADITAFIAAMREAAQQLASPGAKPKRSPWWRPAVGPVWAAAAIVLLAITPVSLHFLRVSGKQPAVPDDVYLQSRRGALAQPQAEPGRPLLLDLDLSGLPEQQSYRIELADPKGQTIWSKVAPAQATDVRAQSAGLSSGAYFVRLYSLSGELLREYALRVGEKR